MPELSRSPQNLVRTQGVELVESVKDHDVGEHVLSVEEGIVTTSMSYSKIAVNPYPAVPLRETRFVSRVEEIFHARSTASKRVGLCEPH